MSVKPPADVVAFAPGKQRDGQVADAAERTGRAIVALLEEAANLVQDNAAHAVGTAHRLSMELRASEDHVQQLQAQLRAMEARAVQAEEWLQYIYKEIDQNFVRHTPTPGHRTAAE